MIDLNLLREHPEQVINAVKRKDPYFAIDDLIQLDQRLRNLKTQVDTLRAEKNELARSAQKGVTQEIRERSKALEPLLKDTELEFKVVQKEFEALYLFCPNLPAEDVPKGNKESNQVVRVWGERPTFTFAPKNHVELGERMGWFDFGAAARMTGSNFVLYKNDGVNLMYALALFMYMNNRKHGFDPVLPPYLVNESALIGASNFPRFREDVYEIAREKLYLTPTSEVNLANVYRDHIFSVTELPKRMTSWTSCFRREAGGYGATERGLIRIHQFEKVELYTLCKPEESEQEQERMLRTAEELLQKLGLHYRVSLLAAQDCSFASAKTYDLEVWMPGQGEYKEVSSISNCTDFQARRCGIRFKRDPQGKSALVHTLNGSSLALPRVFVALMETYQKEDGTLKLPEFLHEVAFSW